MMPNETELYFALVLNKIYGPTRPRHWDKFWYSAGSFGRLSALTYKPINPK